MAWEPGLGAAGGEDAGGLFDDRLSDGGVGPVSGGAEQVVDHRVAERDAVLDRRGDRVGALGLEQLGRVQPVGEFEVGGVEVGGGEVPEGLLRRRSSRRGRSRWPRRSGRGRRRG